MFVSSADFSQNQLFSEKKLSTFSGVPSKCQTVLILVRPDVQAVGPDPGPNCL